MAQKIVGWLVFFSGLALIVFALVSSYDMFTGQTPLPEFFKMPEAGQAVSKAGAQTMEAQLQNAIGEQIGTQLKNLFPADFTGKILNLGVWSMLAFILMSGGAKISGLGIKLLKDGKEKEK